MTGKEDINQVRRRLHDERVADQEIINDISRLAGAALGLVAITGGSRSEYIPFRPKIVDRVAGRYLDAEQTPSKGVLLMSRETSRIRSTSHLTEDRKLIYVARKLVTPATIHEPINLEFEEIKELHGQHHRDTTKYEDTIRGAKLRMVFDEPKESVSALATALLRHQNPNVDDYVNWIARYCGDYNLDTPEV